jgi:hypothetical protein
MSYGNWFGEVEGAWTSSMQLIENQPAVPMLPMDTADNSNKKKKHSHWHNMVDGAENLANSAVDGISSIGSDIIGFGSDIYNGVLSGGETVINKTESLGENALHGAEHAGTSVWHGVEDVSTSVFHGVEDVGSWGYEKASGAVSKVKHVGYDIEHIILIGGGLLVAGAMVWGTKDENRQWAYEKGKQGFQAGKKMATAAMIA